MPKKIDPAVKERCVRQVLEHLPEYPSLTAAAESVARREGLGKETVRRWVVQAQVDGGQRQGATSDELAEIKELKAKVRRLEEDNEILRRPRFSSRGNSTPAIADRRVHRRATVRGPRGRVDLPGPARAGLPDRRTDLPRLGTSQPTRRRPHGYRRTCDQPGP